MMMHMVGAFAEFERDMIRKRTREGLESAREEGRIGGRPSKLSVAQRAAAVEDVMSGRRTVAATARLWNVSPTTVSGMVGAARRPVAPTKKVAERKVKRPIPAIRPARAKFRAVRREAP
jgi:DNA invertase Pin-like site-specific DNA recombinase